MGLDLIHISPEKWRSNRCCSFDVGMSLDEQHMLFLYFWPRSNTDRLYIYIVYINIYYSQKIDRGVMDFGFIARY